jgi:hypothetical protein
MGMAVEGGGRFLLGKSITRAGGGQTYRQSERVYTKVRYH